LLLLFNPEFLLIQGGEKTSMNLKIRFKNPVFIAQLFLSIFTPILTYAGLTFQDLTSW